MNAKHGVGITTNPQTPKADLAEFEKTWATKMSRDDGGMRTTLGDVDEEDEALADDVGEAGEDSMPTLRN